MSREIFEKVCGAIDGSRDVIVEYQRALTAAVALGPESGGTGEGEKAALVVKLLGEIGVKDVRVAWIPDARLPGPGRPNVIATLPGADPSRSVWVMSHLDVVPPGDLKNWHSDPWQVRVEGDLVYGRGTEDNGQGIVASLVLARALAAAGAAPRCNVKLLFVADEETGSAYGIGGLLAREKDLFGPSDIVIVPDGGEPDGSMIEVAEKSILWTKFTLEGKQTHGSTPGRGVNAHAAGARLVVALEEGLAADFPARDPVFDPPESTFAPTKKEANVPNVNTVPGEDVFYLDSRVLPCYRLEQVKGRLRAYADGVEARCGVKVRIEYVQEAQAAPPTPVDSPVVGALARAVRDVYGVEGRPMGIGGGTVAAHLRHRGVPAAVWARMDETMHGPDEYVKISNIQGDAKVFAHVCLVAG